MNTKRIKGMTFIEVLIALFIMVTGILGAVAVQASAKKGSFDAMQRSLASALAQDILERMRSNDNQAATLELYDGVYGAAALAAPPIRCNSPANLCTDAQRATNDLYEWVQLLRGADATFANAGATNNAGGLLNASGCITHANNIVTVVVSWQGRIESSDGASSNSNLAQQCGTSNNKRRQIVVNGFVY